MYSNKDKQIINKKVYQKFCGKIGNEKTMKYCTWAVDSGKRDPDGFEDFLKKYQTLDEKSRN